MLRASLKLRSLIKASTANLFKIHQWCSLWENRRRSSPFTSLNFIQLTAVFQQWCYFLSHTRRQISCKHLGLSINILSCLNKAVRNINIKVKRIMSNWQKAITLKSWWTRALVCLRMFFLVRLFFVLVWEKRVLVDLYLHRCVLVSG